MGNEFNVLAVGDVVGQESVAYLEKTLGRLRDRLNVDFCVVNGENAAAGNGIDRQSAERIFRSGADVITSGNHIWQKKEAYSLLDEAEYLLRPANYPSDAPGNGYVVIDVGGLRVLVISVMGVVFLEPLDDPFRTVDRILKEVRDYDLSFVDLHAEATSEKRAMGFYLDGRVTALWGTHTHVQTADLTILPNGTGYITDLGMTGPRDSVLGVQSEIIIRKMKTHMPGRFDLAEGNIHLHGALFSVSKITEKVVSTRLINTENEDYFK